MINPGINAAARVALRALLRSAETFDRQPLLKALICRHPDVHPHLPADLNSVIATFLGGELRTYYVPSGAGRTDSLRAAVLVMYHSPPLGCDDVDTPLACMRYLGSLLRIGRKHSLMSASDRDDVGRTGFAAPALQLLPQPEQGCVLLAHPLTGAGVAEVQGEQGTPFTFTQAAMLVCGHSTSLGTYALCLNKPLPVKAGALVLGSPLTRALIGELFSWPQSEQESSKQLVRRWQAMYQLHRTDPELGLGGQIEAADNLGMSPYTRLQLLLHEKGWFEEAVAAAAAAAEQAQEQSSNTGSSSAGSSCPMRRSAPDGISGAEQPAASTTLPDAIGNSSTDKEQRLGPDVSLQPQPMLGDPDRLGSHPSQMTASVPTGSSHAGAPHSTAGACQAPEHPEQQADLAQMHTVGSSQAAACSSSSQSAKEQRAARRQAEADRSWDSLLLRFAESSLSKGGPQPSLQVLHRAAALGGQPVLLPSQAGSSDGLFLGTTAEGLEDLDPRLATDMHFFVGDAMWQPDQLETEAARGCWVAVSPPPALRDPQGFRNRLSGLWAETLHALGGSFAQLPRINKAVVDDLKALEL